MKIPKKAQCDNHENKVSVAKFQYFKNGVQQEEKLCLNCGDLWWHINQGNEYILATLNIVQLTGEDLKE